MNRKTFFKPGDRVIINDCAYGTSENYIGKICTVEVGIYNAWECGRVRAEDGCDFPVLVEEIRMAGVKKIVVTTDGTETLARMYEDGKVVKKATARCSKDDTFDFETGARIALSRLIPGEEKPKYYTGRFVVIGKRTGKTATAGITIGKIYEAKGGKFIDDYGVPRPFSDPETLDSISKSIGYDLLEIKDEQAPHVIEEKMQKNLLTGRVICTESGEPGNFTVGKIYNVENGEYTSDCGFRYKSLLLRDVDEQDMCTMHFVKIKE